MKKTTKKKKIKHEKPLSLSGMTFDEAMKQIVNVKPPTKGLKSSGRRKNK